MPITDENATALRWAAVTCEAAMAERDDSRTAMAIRVLMMLPTSGERIDADKAEAWLMLLDDLPVWAIEHACVTYARKNQWRPSPAQIRELCERATALPRRIIENAKHLPKEQAQ